MDRQTVMLFVTSAGSLTVMIGLIHFIGVYFAVPALLVFYVRFVGHHSWWLTSVVAVGDAGGDVPLLRDRAPDHTSQGPYRAHVLPAL